MTSIVPDYQPCHHCCNLVWYSFLPTHHMSSYSYIIYNLNRKIIITSGSVSPLCFIYYLWSKQVPVLAQLTIQSRLGKKLHCSFSLTDHFYYTSVDLTLKFTKILFSTFHRYTFSSFSQALGNCLKIKPPAEQEDAILSSLLKRCLAARFSWINMHIIFDYHMHCTKVRLETTFCRHELYNSCGCAIKDNKISYWHLFSCKRKLYSHEKCIVCTIWFLCQHIQQI